VGDMADATMKRLGETDGKVDEVAAQIANLEQKMARGTGSLEAPAETWGSEFIAKSGDAVRDLSGVNKGSVGLNLKAAITTGPTSAGALEIPTRDQTVLLPVRRLTIRHLLPVVGISTGSVEYVRQTTRPQSAATVAETMLKPESSMTFALQNTSAKVIAHWIPASRQVLEDLPQLRDIIDTQMVYGLRLQEEAQLLYGDGTGENLLGLIPQATAYAPPFAITGATMFDTIGSAILQAALADLPADGIVMHPADWVRMRLMKDGDGKYILGDPQATVAPNLFGLPVVPTKAIAVDKFLVGNFAEAATLYDRWAPRVEVGYINDQFVRNMVSILAEERIALAVKQSAALIFGDFGFAS
jgi:HK97 family phage major capsid protein